MTNLRINIIILVSLFNFGFVSCCKLLAQTVEHTHEKTMPPENWFNLDEEIDGIPGISTERAYKELLKNRKSKKIIVAILDDGIDIHHEDLQGKIWRNTNEIEGNGIDDDQNGYIDDINGWNFLGGQDGKSVVYDNSVLTRIVTSYESDIELYGIKSLSHEEIQEFEELKAILENQIKTIKVARNGLIEKRNKLIKSEKILSSYFETEDYSFSDIQNINSKIDSVNDAIKIVLAFKNKNLSQEVLTEKIELADFFINYYYNKEFDPRYIIGDDYNNKTERYYGNNDVVGPDASHGTQVAGIIGANRYNKIGIKGIADNVELMAIRMSCFGDERDKDIANSIYYAVDNGAQIINMSFEKQYSPDKIYVDRAVKYAEQNNVLIIHCSGNNSLNIDNEKVYPCREYNDEKAKCKTWIEVGASSWQKGQNLAADFTNYGSLNVDLFAPGVDILTTSINQNYIIDSGTSFSAPVVVGVAALVWSYYPELNIDQLLSILYKSAEPKLLLVNKPGETDQLIPFNTLSKTGGIINVYNAIMLADQMNR